MMNQFMRNHHHCLQIYPDHIHQYNHDVMKDENRKGDNHLIHLPHDMHYVMSDPRNKIRQLNYVPTGSNT
ncbi:unnamed protein product [Onchocerca flexuosa]|uniref:Ovule protein n=1 Tax=Onchocerca flexuosa TaxID=387005 RepID=A0A183HS17_9BILA|nr:unnamed protein product [Onchocerca flexuosa]